MKQKNNRKRNHRISLNQVERVAELRQEQRLPGKKLVFALSDVLMLCL